jgi:hypothetical protein
MQIDFIMIEQHIDLMIQWCSLGFEILIIDILLTQSKAIHLKFIVMIRQQHCYEHTKQLDEALSQ